MQGCANCGTTMQTLEYHGHSGSYCSMSCMGEKEKGGGSGKADPLGTGSGRQVPDKIFGPETTQVQDLSQYARATGQLMVEDRDNKQDEEFQS